MKFEVTDDCIGCGLCPSIEGSVFRMTDDNVAEAYAEATEDTKESAIEAMNSCPVDAIKEV